MQLRADLSGTSSLRKQGPSLQAWWCLRGGKPVGSDRLWIGVIRSCCRPRNDGLIIGSVIYLILFDQIHQLILAGLLFCLLCNKVLCVN